MISGASDSSAVAKLITQFEEILPREELTVPRNYLIEKSPGIIREFYGILEEYNELKRNQLFIDPASKAQKLMEIQIRFTEFFAKNGVELQTDMASLVNETLPNKKQLENDLAKQTLLYMRAYIFTHLAFDGQGKLLLRESESSHLSEVYRIFAQKLLVKLEEVNYSPAFNLHSYLIKSDREKAMQLDMRGAELGNASCKAKMARVI